MNYKCWYCNKINVVETDNSDYFRMLSLIASVEVLINNEDYEKIVCYTDELRDLIGSHIN